MIKLETHCHSLGGSGCATTPPDKIAYAYSQAGYGGIVLTNHYCANCFETYPGTTQKQKLDFYFSLVEKMKSECSKYGIRVFFGSEIRARRDDGLYSEYMLYGFDKQFLYDNEPLFNYSQEELFKLADGENLLLYQTHPFRCGVAVGNSAFMHGAESFNGHFHHANNNNLAQKFCEKNKLIQLSGTDFHHEGQPITAGIIVPDDLANEKALVDYIRGGAELICNRALYEKEFEKHRNAR